MLPQDKISDAVMPVFFHPHNNHAKQKTISILQFQGISKIHPDSPSFSKRGTSSIPRWRGTNNDDAVGHLDAEKVCALISISSWCFHT